MALGKQAKILTKAQQERVAAHLKTTRAPLRNELIFLLSTKAALRAKEISELKWSMVQDLDGALTDEIALTNSASKGRSGGRRIPIHPELKGALIAWRAEQITEQGPGAEFVISTQRRGRASSQTIVDLLRRHYLALGLKGASSHSGRRGAITEWAKKISAGAGGSLRDVQELAGHSNLSTTQRYIDTAPDAQRRVVLGISGVK